ARTPFDLNVGHFSSARHKPRRIGFVGATKAPFLGLAHEPRLAPRRGAFPAPYTSPAGWASSGLQKPRSLAGAGTTFDLKEGRFSSARHKPRRMGFVVAINRICALVLPSHLLLLSPMRFLLC